MEIKRMDSNKRMSDIVEYNNTLYFSGIVSQKETFAEQVKDVLNQFEQCLKQAGSDKTRILTALIILKDMENFSELNEIWEEWFDGYGVPTRATFKGELARPNMLVEIIFTAATGEK